LKPGEARGADDLVVGVFSGRKALAGGKDRQRHGTDGTSLTVYGPLTFL
jgi:hypothetical protein